MSNFAKKSVRMSNSVAIESGKLPDDRIVWLDVARFVAMFTLLCCHCANPFNWVPADSPIAGEVKLWGGIYGAMLRHSVPFFVMLTGALLLPVKRDASSFYKKRISRIFWPFLIWSIIYCLAPWFIGVLGFGSNVVQSFFPYAGQDFLTQSLDVSLKHIALLPFDFSTIGLHMWYIYMLIGVYLYMPIFSCWIEKASDRSKLNFLIGWGIASCVPYLCQFISPNIWGSCSWNHFGMFYYFAGYNGYLLLGNYLREKSWSVRQVCFIGIPMFIVGYLITYFGREYMLSIPNCDENMAELFWTNNSLNVIMMVIPLFMACKLVKIRTERVKALLANLTLCGFGIYMIHYFFIGYSVIFMRNIGVPISLQIPCAAVFAFALSWIVAALGTKCLGKYSIWILGSCQRKRPSKDKEKDKSSNQVKI